MAPEVSRGFVIKRLTPSDLSRLVELWDESGLSYKPRGRDAMVSLQRQMRATPALFLGAFVGKRLVGAVIASDDGRRGWINRLAVLSDHRRKGVARALMKAAEDALRRRGRHLFCVHVESDNEPSMSMLVDSGYVREDEILYYTKRERKSY